MKARNIILGVAALALLLPEFGEALPLRVRPRLSLRGRIRSGVRPGGSLLSRPADALGSRRRTRVEQREASLGTNPAARHKDTGIENPDHIRNQDQLVSRAETIAKENGDELVGPSVAYYRTSHGRLIRVEPNAGTGNLRQAARLRNGETLARLEQVGYATRNGNRLLWVTSAGSGSRIGILRGQNYARATGGLIGGAALVFGKDVIRWLGIRNSAEVLEDKVKPEEEQLGPEIVIDQQGQIHIDGDGDGRQDLEVQGQQGGGAVVNGQNGAAVIVDQGTVRTSQDEDGQQEVRIDPNDTDPTGPYGLP